MSPVAFEVAQLFDGFPEPVLILREREVRYRNPAAERLFPALRDRATLPEDLSALLPECEAPAVVTARIGGGNYRLSVQNTSLGALVILRSAPAAAAASSERLSRYLRQQTAGLAAALQRLGADPEGLDPAIAYVRATKLEIVGEASVTALRAGDEEIPCQCVFLLRHAIPPTDLLPALELENGCVIYDDGRPNYHTRDGREFAEVIEVQSGEIVGYTEITNDSK